MSELGVAQPARAILLGDGRTIEMRAHACFACGELNLSGLQLRLHYQGGTCWTETVLDARFNGWEGIIHGGITCAILDEVMAWSLLDEDCWGFTARLAVAFRRPITVGSRVRGEGWIVRRRRRLVHTEGRLIDTASGDVLATAEATYMDAPEEQKAAWRRRYDFRIVPASAAP